MGGKPSKGTKADKRLKANKRAAAKPAKSGKSVLFGGKRATPFKKGGGKG